MMCEASEAKIQRRRPTAWWIVVAALTGVVALGWHAPTWAQVEKLDPSTEGLEDIPPEVLQQLEEMAKESVRRRQQEEQEAAKPEAKPSQPAEGASSKPAQAVPKPIRKALPKRPTKAAPVVAMPQPTPAAPATPAQPAAQGSSAQAGPDGSVVEQSAESAVPERPYNMNYKDRQWKDVIEDISKISGLPVIGQEPPSGTVTFINKEPMTYKEALRTLNDLLFHENFHLARFDNYLLLMQLSDWARVIPLEYYYDSEALFRAADVDEDQFVQVFYSPTEGVAGELIDLARGVVPDYCRIGTVEGSNLISVTCMAKDARKFLDYVHKFDLVREDPREEKVFKLEYAKASDVLSMLHKLVEFSGKAPLQPAPASARRRSKTPVPDDGDGAETGAVVGVVEESNNWLIIRAPSTKMRQIDKLVAMLDVPGADDAREPEVFPLQYMQAEDMVNLINQVFSGKLAKGVRGKRASVGGDVPTVIAEGRTNSVIVMGEDDAVARVKVLIDRFDVAYEEEGFKRVTLSNADAAQLVDTVTKLMSAGTSAKKRGRAGQPQLLADPNGEGILISGDPAMVAKAEAMIRELDQPGASGSLEHLVQLDSAKPSVLAKVLQQLFQKPGSKRGQEAIKFVASDESGVLLVVAPPGDWDRVEAMIKDLDSRATEIERTVHTWTLQYADAQPVINTLKQVLGGGRGAPKLAAEPGSNTIMVQCDQADRETITKLIEILDKPDDAIEPKLIEIENADATELAGMLQQIFGAARGKGRGKGAAGDVMIMEAAGGLLVKAPADEFDRIVGMIATLDKPGASDMAVRTHMLKYAEANATANTLRQVLQAHAGVAGKKGRGAKGVTVSADPATNQIVVAAPSALMAVAEDVITQIDSPDASEGREVRVVSLDRASGVELAKVVMQAFGGGKGRGASLSATADATDRQIVLVGLADQVDRAERLIHDLDAQAEPSQVEIATFELAEASAKDVGNQIKMLMADDIKPRGKGLPAMTVSGDDRINTVLASGTAKQLAKVKELIALLDKAVEEVPVHWIDVKHGGVEEVAESVRSMAAARWAEKDRPKIEPDTWFNSLMVICAEEQFLPIKEMVAVVDKPKPEDLIPVKQAYRPKNVDADALLDVLQQYAEAYNYRLKIKRVETQRNEQDQIERIMKSKEVPLPGTLPCVLSMRTAAMAAVCAEIDGLLAQTGESLSVEDAVKQSIEQGAQTSEVTLGADGGAAQAEVNVTIDEQGRLILQGPQKAIEDLAYVIEKIDEAEPAKEEKRVMKIYQLEHLSASTAAQWVDKFFNVPVRPTPQAKQPAQPNQKNAEQAKQQAQQQAQQRAQQQAQQRAAAAAARQKKVQVMPLARQNWLVIWATPEDLDPVLQLLARLDVPQGPPNRIEIIPLEHLIAVDVEATLKSVLGLGVAKGRTPASRARGATSPEAQEQLLQLEGEGGEIEAGIGSADLITIASDPTANTLIVSAPEDAFNLIKGFVDRLEAQSPGASEIRTIELVNAGVADVLPQLEAIFSQQGGARGAKDSAVEIGKVTFSADERNNWIVVRGRGRDLDEVERLAKQLDVATGSDQVQLIPVLHADVEQLSETLQSVFVTGRSGGRGRRGRASASSQIVQIMPNAATKTLLVKAPVDTFKEIIDLVKQLDVDGAGGTDVKVFHLQHALASEALTKLQEIGRQMMGGRRGGNTMAATADDRTNALIVVGNADVFAMIDEVLKDVDVPDAAPEVRTLHTIQLANSDVRDVSRAINRLFQEMQRGKSSRGRQQASPHAEYDLGTNTLLVYATVEEVKQIKEQIIDKLEEFESPQAQLASYQIPLKYAKADDIGRTLSQYFRQRQSDARRIGGAGPKPADVVTIVSDPTGNTLLVQCSESNKTLIDGLLVSMDSESVEARDRSTKVFGLKYADANAVADVLRRAYRSSGRGRVDESDQVDAQGESGTQSVVVTANDENMAKVAALIEQLDTESTAQQQLVEVVVLQNAQASDLGDVIGRMLRETRRRSRSGQMPVSVVANESTNAVIISGSASELERVKGLIAELDVPSSAQNERVTKAIKLTYADPYAMASAISNAFRVYGRRERPEDRVVAQGEWGTNSVLVSATRDKFEQIEALVAEIDTDGAGGRKTEVIELKYVEPEDVNNSLREIFMYSRRRGRTGQTPASISFVRGSRNLIVSGTDQELEEIKRIVELLDVPTEEAGEGIETVRLQNLSPEEARDILYEALRKPGRTGRWDQTLTGDVRISVSPTMNALVISGGSVEQRDQIKSLLATLDSGAEEAGTVPRIVVLKTAQSAQLVQQLTKIFTEPAQRNQRSRRGGASQDIVPIIVADEATNTLIVRATKKDFDAIKEMAEAIDSRGDEAEGTVKIVKVADGIDAVNLAREIEQTINSGAQAVARKSKTQAAQISIGVDERTNALIVSGSPELFDDVEDLVRKLEELRPTGTPQMKIINLENIDSERVQRVLDQILQKQSQQRSGTRGSSPGNRGPRGRRSGALPPELTKFGTPVFAMRDDDMLAHVLMMSLLAQTAEPVTTRPAQPEAVQTIDDNQIRGEVSYSVLDGRTIVLQGDDHDLLILEAIISQIDTAAPQQEVEIFTLKNAQAAEIGPKLQQIYQQLIKGLGDRARPEDSVTIIPEPSSNSLIISALPEHMEKIATIIEKLDQQELLGMVTYKTFQMEYITADEAKTQLDSLLDKLWQKRGAKNQVTIEAVPRANQLIITAPEADLVQIEKFIATIDVKPPFSTAKMRIIGLMNADATAMVKVIDEMLSTGAATGAKATLAEQIRRLQLQAREGDELKDLPDLDLEKPIKVIAEPGTNSLIVSSNEENLTAMEAVVDLLDRVPMWYGVKIRIFMLTHGDAEEMAKMLGSVFKDGQKIPGRPGGKALDGAVPESLTGEALVYNVSIAADPRTNAMVVAGREESLALAETLIERLDKPGLALKHPIRLYKLEHTDAKRIAEVVTSLMDKRVEMMSKKAGGTAVERERVFIEHDIRSNMLIIAATEENFNEITDLAHKLDTAPEALVDQIHIINLENTQANVLKPKIEALWKRRNALREAAGGLSADQPVIESDERSNSLVVAANVEDYEVMKRLVEQLEAQPLTPIADIRLIPLEQNDASTIAPLIKKLFDERAKMRSADGKVLPSDQVAVEFDQATNALLVAASVENYESMVALVKKIDVEMPLGGVLQFYTLEFADASRVAERISTLFEEGLWKPGSMGAETEISKARNKVAIIVDERTNTLIVSAAKENYAIVSMIIEQMDREEDFLVGNLQLFELKYADALKLAALLGDLFDKMDKARQSVIKTTVELPMTIIPEPSTNTLLIAGSRDGLTRAAKLIERFDRRANEPTSVFEAYTLRQADAVRIAPVIERMFKDRKGADDASPVIIEAEAGTNSLIVSASREDHDLVVSLIDMLDRPSTTAEQIRIFPLRKGKAEDIQKALSDLYSKRKGGSEEQSLGFGTDARTNSLIVYGAAGELTDIERVIERLDTTEPTAEQTVRIFQLKQADSEKMAEMLNDVMTGGKSGTAVETALISLIEEDEQGAKTIRTLLREKVQIIPDVRTNSLIVMALPESIDMLEHLIAKLDSIAPELAVVEVFRLKNADAGETVKTLETLFKSEVQTTGGGTEEERRLVLAGGQAGTGGRAWLRFTADVRTNAVIAAGSQEYLALVKELIDKLDAEAADDRIHHVISLNNAEATNVQSALSQFISSEVDRLGQLGDESALRKIEREISVVAYEDTQQLMLAVSPRYESQIMKLVEELDQAQPQVMIQALLVQVNLTDDFNMGMEFALQDLLFSSTARVGRNGLLESNNFDVVGGTSFGVPGTGGLSFSIAGEDFSFILRALETEGSLQVLSSPSILAMDNTEAEISVGQKVPVVNNVTITDSGNTQSSFTYQTVSTRIRVTPKISPEGFVELEVAPEISSVSDSTVNVGGGVNASILNESVVTTTITVMDGETAVIGGLITTTDAESESRVPIIGEIPVLGELFKSTRRTHNKSELLIVLTPHVIRTPAELRALSEEARDRGSLPRKALGSPLMNGLQVEAVESMQDEHSVPTEAPTDVPTDVPAEPATATPARDEKPARPVYGPLKWQLSESAAPAEVLEQGVATHEGRDDYETYRWQRH